MKGLLTLIRLHKAALDDQRVELVALEAERDRLLAAVAALDETIASERRSASESASSETAAAFGPFLTATRDRQGLLNDAAAALAPEIEARAEAVRVAFAELKKFELTAERRRQSERDAANAREQKALDELGLSMFRARDE